MTNSRRLVSEVMNDRQFLTIRINGWRINVDMKHQHVHAANEDKDGLCAGWCACLYDRNIEARDLVLVGDEREINLPTKNYEAVRKLSAVLAGVP